MRKRLLSLLLSLSLCAGLTVPALATGPQAFQDVPTSHWAYSNIQQAYDDGVINGTSYNASTQVRLFSPDGTLTMAQFITIITRAFYMDEVEKSTATGTWYARNEAVAKANNLFSKIPGQKYYPDSAVSRYDMAAIMCAVMEDMGAEMPTTSDRASVIGRITDWYRIPLSYRTVVADVYFLGIITGFGDGSFGGYENMNRAQCAAIYVRLKDAIERLGGTGNAGDNGDSGDSGDTGDSGEGSQTPVTPPAGAAALGTISSSKVTLSLDTHNVDYIGINYWEEQSAEIKRLTAGAEDAFNAAVHSMIHVDTITNQGQFGSGIGKSYINEYYHYAVYKPEYSTRSLVENSTSNMYYSLGSTAAASTNGLWYFTVKNKSQVDKLMPVFEQYLRHVSPDAKDRAVANLMMSYVNEKFQYEVGGGATWLNGKLTGDCDDYNLILAQLLSAAGIPNLIVSAANHAWNQVYLADEGKWLIYDASDVEVGASGVYEFATHASKYRYDNDDINNADYYKVARALIETACKYR